MTSFLKIAGVSLALGLLSMSAEAARRRPVVAVTLTTIDAPPRGAPGPIAGAGLPAVAVLGAYLWRQARRAKAAKLAPDNGLN